MKVPVKYFDPDLHTQFYQAALSEATLRVPEKKQEPHMERVPAISLIRDGAVTPPGTF